MSTDPEYLRACLDLWLEAARDKAQHAYLLIDGNWQRDLVEMVRSSDDGWEPLFGYPNLPKQEAHLRSPLIVDLFARPEVIEPWLKDGFPARLGMACFSKLPIEEFRTSMKRFQNVHVPAFKEPVYLRFYDGRILNCFLRTGYPEQWQDYLRDIELLMAPTDVSKGWTLYRLSRSQGTLFSASSDDAEETMEWEEVPVTIDETETYLKADPFRTIGPEQYGAIERCARQGFHLEVLRFLEQAFPDVCTPEREKEHLATIAMGHDDFDNKQLPGERAAFYWCILVWMLGLGFDMKPQTARHLANGIHDLETKLEDLFLVMNRELRSQHILQLVDTMETHLEFAGGRKVSYKTRSGKMLTDTTVQ